MKGSVQVFGVLWAHISDRFAFTSFEIKAVSFHIFKNTENKKVNGLENKF